MLQAAPALVQQTPNGMLTLRCGPDGKGERLDIDPSGARCGCFLPDLTRLARHLPAPTSLGLYRGLELTLQFIAGAN